MKKITVKLKHFKYIIQIASGLSNNFNTFSILKKNDKVMIITNEKLASIYLKLIKNMFNHNRIKINYIIIPEGEKFKNLSTANLIYTKLIKKMHGRDTILISLGGGVINDLTGFVAATYQRGVKLIHIPTTLLAQVDASIGGKTAVNHNDGKNMIGVFYQPNSVIIDTDFLNTLPKREIKSGMAEIIKYGIIFDENFFSWIEKNINELIILNNKLITECIYRCCIIKSKIVQMDENDKNIRMILNLGHTYGHAIETFMKYNGSWLHGEAISVGIAMASRASYLIKKINIYDFNRIIALLKKAGLPTTGPKNMKVNDYLNIIMHDKKVISNKLRIILPIKIGKADVFSNINKEIIYQSIQDCI